jgi:hypothetical protein
LTVNGTNQYGHTPPPDFGVDLPAGGRLTLNSVEEVDLWEESAKRYLQDYQLSQQNDLLLLGAILSQQLAMFRAQQRMNGMKPQLDEKGVPTGQYVRSELKVNEMGAAQTTIIKASTEIRELEKALGIDKKTREQGGAHTVQNYVTTLKKAAREYGIHLNERMKAYEKVSMDARWKLRLLRNGDPEDRAYHKLTPQAFCDWLEGELAKLEEIDKTYARDKHAVFVGRGF